MRIHDPKCHNSTCRSASCDEDADHCTCTPIPVNDSCPMRHRWGMTTPCKVCHALDAEYQAGYKHGCADSVCTKAHWPYSYSGVSSTSVTQPAITWTSNLTHRPPEDPPMLSVVN